MELLLHAVVVLQGNSETASKIAHVNSLSDSVLLVGFYTHIFLIATTSTSVIVSMIERRHNHKLVLTFASCNTSYLPQRFWFWL